MCSSDLHDAGAKAHESGMGSVRYDIPNTRLLLGVDAVVQLPAVVGVHVRHVHFGNLNALRCQVFNQLLRCLLNFLLVRLDFLQRLIDGVRIQFQFDG